MKKRTFKWLTIGFIALYPASYLVTSRNGFYEPAVYGLISGHNDETILAPKAAFGYDWIPFEGYYSNQGVDGVSLAGWLYRPLVVLDRATWHTQDRWESMPERTKNYFDYEARKYLPAR